MHRQRPLGIAPNWQPVAFRVRAPDRVESCIGMGEDRGRGDSLCAGLFLIVQSGSTPRVALPTRMDTHMLHENGLPAATSQLRQGFSL
jgi:hypothetical protein